MVSKSRLAVLSAIACLCMGCKQRVESAPASAPVSKNTLHITSVTPDGTPDVTGTLNGNEYALSVDRRGVPLYVAYYEPIGILDVGKNFPAQIDEGSEELIVQVPDKGTVHYSIRSVHERN